MRGATLKELYEERVPLYERYADLTIAADGKTADELAKELSLL